ncbi:MAG: oligosaccharide flippase family protein, partial [Kangiellaceae bacterium]|nr:oligosaccharide flippase family protein [Kangiellaceae bacterium]
SIFVGIFMALVVLGLAYPNAYIFNNDELVPITQLVSIMFVASSIGTVPQNILSRNYRFKDIALINMAASIVTSLISVWMAYAGMGVYTLIYSAILLGLLKSVGYFLVSNWRPNFCFNFTEVKPFLKFGMTLSLSDSVARLLESFDKLIIGKLYNEVLLGYYSTAISISSMPIDKLSPLINPVLFPMFSRWQGDKEKSTNAYLKILKYYLFLMSNIYMGALAVADNLILLVLGEKWINIAFIFKGFCIVQLFKVLSSYHKVLLTSQGKASQILKYDISTAVLLLASILIAAFESFNAVVYAWVIVYPLVTIIWMFTSLKSGGISFVSYLRTVFQGAFTSVIMFLVVTIVSVTFNDFIDTLSTFNIVFFQASIAAVVFFTFTIVFQRQLLIEMWQLFKRK